MNAARYISITAPSAVLAVELAQDRAVKIDRWADGTKVFHLEDGSALKIEGKRFSALPTAMVH